MRSLRERRGSSLFAAFLHALSLGVDGCVCVCVCVLRFLFFVGISYNRITFLTAAMAASKTSASYDTTDTTKPLTLNRRKEISLLSQCM